MLCCLLSLIDESYHLNQLINGQTLLTYSSFKCLSTDTILASCIILLIIWASYSDNISYLRIFNVCTGMKFSIILVKAKFKRLN